MTVTDSLAAEEREHLHRLGLMRRHGAVVVIDQASSVHRIERDELGAVAQWVDFIARVRADILPVHEGRLVKSLGDGLLLEFSDVRQAVRAALALRTLSRTLQTEFGLRIGIESGAFLSTALDVYGVAVNRAARLMERASPGQIVISEQVRAYLVEDVDARLDDLGPQLLRHAQEPVRGYAVHDPVDRAESEIPPDVAMAPTLAIIPFRAEPQSPDFAALGDILCDALISDYSHSPFLHVIAHLSSQKLKSVAAPTELSRQLLRADYLLSGLIRVRGEQADFFVEVTETQSGDVIATGHLPLSIDGTFAHYRDTLERLRQMIANAIHGREIAQSASVPMQQVASHALLMKAIHIMHQLTPSAFSEAKRMLDLLCAREPRHPAPYAWTAHWHHLRIQQGWSEAIATDAVAARTACAQALDRNPDSSLALAVSGLMAAVFDRQPAMAERYSRHAVAVCPSDARAWLYFGAKHIFSDEGPQAVRAVKRASHLSPLDPYRFMFDSIAASAYFVSQNYAEAAAMAEQAYRRNRRHASTLRVRAAALLRIGHGEQARAAAAEMMAQEPGFTISSWQRRSPASDARSGRDLCDAFRALGVPA